MHLPILFRPESRGSLICAAACWMMRVLSLALLPLAIVVGLAQPGQCQQQWPFASVHAFSGPDGTGNPVAPLLQASDGNFYGITHAGGSTYVAGASDGLGTIFKVTPAGTMTLLHSFTGTDGLWPFVPLIQTSNGTLYGGTALGGPNYNPSQGILASGTIFSISTSGSLQTLATFNGTNGVDPDQLVLGSDGNFYGTTYYGGPDFNGNNDSGFGTVFKLTPTGTLTSLHSFSGPDGQYPRRLVAAASGVFYGVTESGGQDDLGTVFRVSSSGQLQTIYSFSGPDGRRPISLFLGADGNLYGTTYYGGANYQAETGFYGSGTIFELTPSGTLTTLHSFSGSDGANPFALVPGSNGAVYGTTQAGGSSGNGTVFLLQPAGTNSTLTTVYNFTGGADGAEPGWLTLSSDSKLYGMGFGGGSYDEGTLFEVAATLHQFPAGVQMISAPENFTGDTISQIFDTQDDISLLTFNPLLGAKGQYVSASTINLGVGYWASMPAQESLFSLGTAAIASASTNIPLSPGWNIIGDPYFATVPVSQLQVISGTTTLSFAQAASRGLISNTLSTLPAGSSAYQTVSSTGLILPYVGYWIWSKNTSTLVVPAP